MRRRPLALVLTAALIGAVFTALPARAETAIPATVNIEDPLNDANTTSGDVTGPADASTVGDILKVWFTNDATTISLYFLTEAPAPSSTGTAFEVFANQTEGFTGYMNGCLRFMMLVPGNTPVGGAYQGDGITKVYDRCNDGTSTYGNGAEGELTVEELGDGTGLHIAKFPRAYSPLLADDAILTNLQATTRLPVGTSQAKPDGSGPVGYATFRIDDTVEGTDFTISGDGAEPPAVEEPTEPKPAKNPCKKLKGKKKKKCLKKHASKGCATFAPGELGAEAETLVVKDENTAEAPLEITLEHGPGAVRAEVSRSHVIKNLQIDSAAPEAGLYIRYEFPDYEDHDLYVEDAAGNVVGQAAGSNQVSDVPEVGPAANEGTGIGGHSEMGAEVIDGLRTADCAGYTVDFDNFAGEGGEYIAKVWLGEPLNDPAPPAAKAYVL